VREFPYSVHHAVWTFAILSTTIIIAALVLALLLPVRREAHTLPTWRLAVETVGPALLVQLPTAYVIEQVFCLGIGPILGWLLAALVMKRSFAQRFGWPPRLGGPVALLVIALTDFTTIGLLVVCQKLGLG